jgi:hypothetical protein
MRNDYHWRRDAVGDIDGDGCVDDTDLLSVNCHKFVYKSLYNRPFSCA